MSVPHETRSGSGLGPSICVTVLTRRCTSGRCSRPRCLTDPGLHRAACLMEVVGFNRHLAEPPNVDDLRSAIAAAPARSPTPADGSSGGRSGEAQPPGERHG